MCISRFATTTLRQYSTEYRKNTSQERSLRQPQPQQYYRISRDDYSTRNAKAYKPGPKHSKDAHKRGAPRRREKFTRRYLFSWKKPFSLTSLKKASSERPLRRTKPQNAMVSCSPVSTPFSSTRPTLICTDAWSFAVIRRLDPELSRFASSRRGRRTVGGG